MSEHSMEAVGRVMDELGFERDSKLDVEMRQAVARWGDAYAIDMVTEAVRGSTVERVEDALETLGVTDTVLMHDGMSAAIARALLDAAEVGS